jgi:hypothetical protein
LTWLDIGYNAYEEGGGYKTIRANFGRVPAVGERIEFRDPEGGATGWPVDIDGNVFYVSEVNWVVAPREGGPQSFPSIFVVPKSMWEG